MREKPIEFFGCCVERGAAPVAGRSAGSGAGALGQLLPLGKRSRADAEAAIRRNVGAPMFRGDDAARRRAAPVHGALAA